jgi:hypothetical protein
MERNNPVDYYINRVERDPTTCLTSWVKGKDSQKLGQKLESGVHNWKAFTFYTYHPPVLYCSMDSRLWTFASFFVALAFHWKFFQELCFAFLMGLLSFLWFYIYFILYILYYIVQNLAVPCHVRFFVWSNFCQTSEPSHRLICALPCTIQF